MSMNDSNNTTQASAGNGPEIGWRRRLSDFAPVFQATFRSVQQKFSAAAKKIEPPSILIPSYADPFVKIGDRAPIDDRKNDIAKILESYAQQPAKSPKDKDKMNKTMIKIFNKLAVYQAAGSDDAYFKCVTSSSTGNIDIDAESIYERLLHCAESKEHPHGVSSFAFAFTSILALSLHRETPNQPPLERNATSPYFDLSPLYGSNAGETNSIRLKDGRGMLWPDCFCEDRLDMVPDAVPALLVLWNRYHNYVAKQLLWHNEKDRWVDPSGPEHDKDMLLAQDEQIFDIARSITSINFMNVIREDFLKGLLGLPLVGPSIEVDILHDASSLRSGAVNGYRSTVESYFLYEFSPFVPPSLASSPRDAATRGNAYLVRDYDIRRRNYTGLKRNRKGYFEDNDLAAILLDATAAGAGAPGANSIANWARDHVFQKIQQARERNVCSLNEFRVHLGLKPLRSFSEWNSNPTVANAAQELYGNVDKLELFPGLLAEEPIGCSGLGLGRTMAWGLTADVVTRIRSDPLFTNRFNVEELTKWGHEDCIRDSRRREKGSFSAMMPKLLERTLPHCYPCDNAYSIFPFTVPMESEARIRKLFPEDRQRKKYDFARPKRGKVKVLRTIEAISKVFNDTDNFRSPYGRHLIELTGGYGNMLGFDDLTLHDRDLMLTLFSLLPDKGAAKRIGAAFAQRARDNLQKRSTPTKATGRATIDVVRDLIDATCVRWVCETIYNLPFPDEDMRKLTDKQRDDAVKEAREKELEAHEDFAAFYAYIFRNAEPEIGWSARERALQASKHLSDHLEKEMDAIKGHTSDANFLNFLRNSITSCGTLVNRVREEYSLHGKRLPQTSAQTFFDRMLKAAEIRPLKHLVEGSHHLTELWDEYKNGSIDDHEASQKVEKQRVIANVVSLAVVISVHFSKACSQAVDFYMDDKYTTERNQLIGLCRSTESTNDQIMGYIREAQRIGQRFGLWREAALQPGQTLTIEQGHGYPDLTIAAGDRVFADFTYAHNDPKQFNNPEKVIPGRKVISLLGLGVHKCPAGSFIDQTMPQVFRVIFSQNNLQRAGENGRLKVATLHPDAASWDPEVFSEEGGGYSFYPKKLMLEFDTVEKPKKFIFTEDKQVVKFVGRMNQALSLFFVSLVLFFTLRFFVSFSGPSSSTAPALGQSNSECGTPLTDVEPWQIRSFRPQWFGMFGEPAPIIYKTSRWGGKAHIISLVAIDKRDIEVRIMIDDMDYGSRHVDLDPTIECGEDIGKCLELGFASGLVQVPPGRHTVKAVIVKQNGTFVWGKERQRRVMWTVQRCP